MRGLEADIVRIETNKGLIGMRSTGSRPCNLGKLEDLANRLLRWADLARSSMGGSNRRPQGTGYGGSGKTIKLEINRQLSNVRGAVGMARSQARDSATSQFYILKADATSLDGDYAIFGRVIEGMEVVDQLAIGDQMLKVTVEPGTPVK